MHRYVFIQVDLGRLPASFCGMMAPAVIHRDAAHQLRSNSHELILVLPVLIFLVGQAEEGFVHQRLGLQGVIGALAT